MKFLAALNSILSIIILITIGLILAHRKVLDEKSQKVFSKLVCNISLPALMISNLMSNFNKKSLIHLRYGLLIPFASISMCYILGFILSKVIRVKKGRIGTFRAMFFGSNTIFIGLPVNLALFGTKATPYVLLYYIVNTSFFWTIGIGDIIKDGDSSKKVKYNFKESARRILSPPLMGFIVAVILILLNVRLPISIMDACRYLGALTTPLSMLFIGAAIYNVKLKDIRLNIDTIVILIGRFIISPMLVIFFSLFIKTPPLMLKVFIIQGAMPVMTQTAITAKAYGGDEKYAAVITSITTLISMVVIPIYMSFI